MTPDPAPPPASPPPAPPARRRWPRRLLGFAVLLSALVWFAPAIVASTPLRNRLIAAASADLKGTVSVGGLSAGWLSAVELRDVVITDPQGRTLLTIPRITTSRTLAGLLRDRGDLGEIEFHNPAAVIVCEGVSTNLEDALADYLKTDRPPDGLRPAVRIRVSDGAVTLHDSATGQSATFTGVGLTAVVPADRAAPVEVELMATAGGASPGTIEVKGEIGSSGPIAIKLAGFPLESAAAVVRRVEPGLSISGTLTADLTGRWSGGTGGVEGTVGARGLAVSGILLKGERIDIPLADLPVKAELTADTARVRVNGGRLVVADGPGGPPVELARLSADVTAPTRGPGPITATLALAATGPAPGTLDVDATIAEHGSAKVRAADFPLAGAAPLLRRVDPAASAAGTLTADLTAHWEGRGTTARVEGTAGVRNLEVAGPWLKGDRLRLAAADLPLKAELRGRSLRVEKAELSCDVGRVSVSGEFDSSLPFDRLLDQPGVSLAGDVDLAKLAAVIPGLLRVREGTAIREGKLAASFVSRPGKDGTTWDGSVRTTALKAVREGKTFEWPEPLSVEFSGRAPAGQLPVFDRLLCKSDFIAVNAQGSAESVRAAANVYLDRLAARLGEFVDLGGVLLGGEASAWVVASRTSAGAFKADAGGELKNLAFAKPGTRVLAEPHLTVRMSATGAWPKDGPVRLDTGSIDVTAGTDRLEARLAAPVPDARGVTGGQVAARVTGDLGRWASRTRGFIGIPADYVFGGVVNATGTFTLAPTAVTGGGITIGISNARFRGAGLDINEPTLNAVGSMTLDRKSGTVVFTPVTITSPTLTARDARFVFEFPEKGPMAVAGSGPAEGDLNGLARTLHLQASPDGPDSLHGRAVGPVRFRWQGETTTFGGTLDVTDFAYGPKARPGWRDPRFKLDLDGKYDQSADRFTIATGRVERPGLVVEGKGTWAKFDTTQDVDVSGTLAYDLAVLTPELRTAVGGGFQAAGKGSRPFALRGSLNPPKGSDGGLTANGGLGWEAVRAFGFEMGPGDLTARVANGVGTVSPVSATFGGGRVSLQPTLKLGPGPGEVSFAKGKVVERAKLTPAVCAGAVGYALPVVANAAQAEGEVSFDLDDNRVPLADFTGATVRGRMLVHRAVVSAGPVVSQVVQLIGEPAPKVVLANEMTVPVRVEAGRVHHENLALTVNGYTVKTNGSVGFDGSLALVADVPIPGTFPGLKNNPALKKALEGRIVKVPIAGTMSQPAINQAAFHNAVAAMARDAAKDAVKDAGRDLLNRELERLFPGAAPGAMPGGPANPQSPGRQPLFPLPPGLPIPKK